MGGMRSFAIRGGWYEAINGWHNFGFAELIQVEIQPVPPSQPGHQ
jgi:hypothetical protein